MSKRRRAELVCRHDTRFQSCSICQPRLSHEADPGTIGERVEAARPRLLRLARLNGIGPDEAEDVVQETCIEAWRHLEKLREPERLSAWLDGICRNICKRHLHAKSSAPHASELSENLDEASTDLSDSFAIDPVEELERQDMQVLLDRALGHLSESTRELIELCYLAELPQREVAQRLDMSLGALELKLHRARRQLRQILHGELREDAQAFGLLLSDEESMGWQETRHWCFVCGKRHLRGIVERQPGGVAVMRLSCPECSPRYNIDLVNTGNSPCPICQSPVQIQIIDRSTLVPPHSLYDALPLGIYARVDCPSCGTGFCEAYIPVLLHTAIRDFILRPRVLYEPAIFTTYAGQDAIGFRLVDLGGTDVLTVMAHPQTLQLMATTRG